MGKGRLWVPEAHGIWQRKGMGTSYKDGMDLQQQIQPEQLEQQPKLGGLPQLQQHSLQPRCTQVPAIAVRAGPMGLYSLPPCSSQHGKAFMQEG
eukprot:3211790-Karenia_brevis.AAC.1